MDRPPKFSIANFSSHSAMNRAGNTPSVVGSLTLLTWRPSYFRVASIMKRILLSSSGTGNIRLGVISTMFWSGVSQTAWNSASIRTMGHSRNVQPYTTAPPHDWTFLATFGKQSSPLSVFVGKMPHQLRAVLALETLTDRSNLRGVNRRNAIVRCHRHPSRGGLDPSRMTLSGEISASNSAADIRPPSITTWRMVWLFDCAARAISEAFS